MLQHVGSRGLLVAGNALILRRLLVLIEVLVDGRSDLVERHFGRILFRLSLVLSGAARDQGTMELDRGGKFEARLTGAILLEVEVGLQLEAVLAGLHKSADDI